MTVGGVRERWEPLVGGEAMVQAVRSAALVGSGDVVLTPRVFQLLGGKVRALRVDEGHALLIEVDPPPPWTGSLPTFDDATRDLARAFVPGAVRARLQAGQSDWLAETRQVSALFANLPGLADADPSVAQRVMEQAQHVVYAHEGSIDKLVVDDKGVTLLAVFGLPPMSHPDDAARALSTALALRRRLEDLGFAGPIGVASGRVFCGAFGGAGRREYTVVGEVVNLAARLMQHARAVLCDEATAVAAAARFRCEAVLPLRLKGIRELMPAFEVVEAASRDSEPTPLVGRVDERRALLDAVARLVDGTPTQVLWVEGELGVGKSRLIGEALDQARALGLGVTVVAGDASSRESPWHAWAPVVTQLAARLDPEEERLRPLLSAIVPTGAPENDLTRGMSPEARLDNTRALLVRLLAADADGEGRVVVVEDAHWLDSASWDVLRGLVRDLRPLLLILASRPLDPPPEPLAALIAVPQASHLRLLPLNAAQSIELARLRLGVRALPPEMARLIEARGEGLPFLVEELALALRDTGLVRVGGDACWLTSDPGALERLGFPPTVEGAVTSRIDRLAPSQQLTLKVASVIGRLFPFLVLHDVHPLPDHRARLPDDLARLDDAGLVEPRAEAWRFRHGVTQQVAYGLLPASQRRALHLAVASWYERHHTDDAEPLLPVLAHHWSQAGDEDRAVHYLARAGESALRSGAPAEALRFLGDAVGRRP